ncbi:MAG: (d)CMP kinase [Candidatus Nanopelagicales bacterium]
MSASVTSPRVLAIDGLSGSGKSTVARAVAGRLGWAFLDTGAMYRAVTLAVLQNGIDPADKAAVVGLLGTLVVEVTTDPRDVRVTLDGVDVAGAIRTPAVTSAVSTVSALPEVRAVLLQWQREAVKRASDTGIVVEGRDIGTVVLPEAPVKIFLVADAPVRAARRAAQDEERTGGERSQGQVLAELQRRDKADSTREVSPLRAAPDAVTIDASELDVDEVVASILHRVTDSVPR